MAKEANKRANNVLKYLRWRNTDAAGNSPTSYRGEVFDTAFGAEIQGIQVWHPADRGQAGHFGAETFVWSWRVWLASLDVVDLDWILGGSHVIAVGCGPFPHTIDPRPGMAGPVWDFTLVLAADPALVGSEQRTVWLHPSANGDLKCMSDDSAPNRFARWYEVRSKGMSEQLRALYPTLGSRKYPRGPGQQIGDQEARARLLGGVCGGAAATALVVAASASSSAACAVAVGDADGGPALQLQPAAASSGTAAHAAAAGTTAMPVIAPLPPPAKALPASLPLAPLDFFEYLNPEQTRARWCGFELEMWDGKIYSFWKGRWWQLTGPSVRVTRYSPDLYQWSEW